MGKTKGMEKGEQSRAKSKGKGMEKGEGSRAKPKGKGKANVASARPNPQYESRLAKGTIVFERGIDIVDLQQTFVVEAVQHRQWRNFVEPPNRANITVVREFYAAMLPDHFKTTGVVTVRGVEVKITAESINQRFNLIGDPELVGGFPFHPWFDGNRHREMAANLRFSGEGYWDTTYSPLTRKELWLESAFWDKFAEYSIMPTQHSSSISPLRAKLLYCLKNDMPLDIGQIIKTRIDKSGAKLDTLCFPCLITYFCEQHGVVTDIQTDEFRFPTTPMNRYDYNALAHERDIETLPVPASRRRGGRRPRLQEQPEQAVQTVEDTGAAPGGNSQPEWVTTLVDTVAEFKHQVDRLGDLIGRAERLEAARSNRRSQSSSYPTTSHPPSESPPDQ